MMQSTDAPDSIAGRPSNEQDKAPTPTSSGSRGIKDFFRKRQKSANSPVTTSLSVDCDSASRAGSHSATCSPSERTSPKPLTPSDVTSSATDGATGGQATRYGNYLTISGTGANALQDLFRRKYRTPSSRDNYSPDSGEQTRSSSTSKKGSFPPPLLRMRSKKDNRGGGGGREEWLERDQTSRSSDSRGIRELFRSRNKSGGPSMGSSFGARGGVRTFFDSFRQRSKTLTESYDDVMDGDAVSGFEQSTVKLQLKKNKKFKVTPAVQEAAPTEDLLRIGPDEYFEMYRNRASSDPKLDARYDARAAVESYRVINRNLN